MSTKDLSNLGRAILRSTLLEPVKTRAWLKPDTHTSNLRLSVGAPWEILRVPGLTKDGRVIDLYTKSGGLGLYASWLVLIPDYDIGLTVFAAGKNSSLPLLIQSTLEGFIPAIEQVGKEQAAARYTGVYDVQPSNLSHAPNSSLEISVDKGPGLVVNRWISNNIDVVKVYNKYFGSNRTSTEVRLYPTGLEKKTGFERTVSYRAFFRSVRLNATNEESTAAEKDDGRVFSGCASWGEIDGYMYGLIGIDDFVFHTDLVGNVKSIEPRATRTTLDRRDSALKSDTT